LLRRAASREKSSLADPLVAVGVAVGVEAGVVAGVGVGVVGGAGGGPIGEGTKAGGEGGKGAARLRDGAGCAKSAAAKAPQRRIASAVTSETHRREADSLSCRTHVLRRVEVGWR
jgi:hypothetical protein